MKKIKIKYLIIIFFVFSIILFFIFFLNNKKQELEEKINNNCYLTKERVINGTSMYPLLENKEIVTTYENYYDCNEIKRNDIIIFDFKTREDTYVKKIVGIPNDILEFENGYIKINGNLATNSIGEKYIINQSQEKMLSIPLEDKIIPKNSYLVLGDNINKSTFDSRKFSFISKQQIIGKVIKN